MYRGDDYGGHNIPYPHPSPPMPHSYYDKTAFVSLDKYYANGQNMSGDVYGYTMRPEGLAGWTPDRAFQGETLVRHIK